MQNFPTLKSKSMATFKKSPLDPLKQKKAAEIQNAWFQIIFHGNFPKTTRTDYRAHAILNSNTFFERAAHRYKYIHPMIFYSSYLAFDAKKYIPKEKKIHSQYYRHFYFRSFLTTAISLVVSIMAGKKPRYIKISNIFVFQMVLTFILFKVSESNYS